MSKADREAQRPSEAQSATGVLACHVADFSQLSCNDVPDWLTRLRVPAGWRTGRLDGGGHQPGRIAVCGERTGGGWDGCETIAVFGFTGFPPIDVIESNSEWTLRNLESDCVATVALATPPVEGVYAVRSTGYFLHGGARDLGAVQLLRCRIGRALPGPPDSTMCIRGVESRSGAEGRYCPA